MAYTSADLTTFFTNGNLGKAPTAAQSLLLQTYASQTQSGAISDQAAIDRIVDMLDGTTAVAVQSYQFFTGGTPSAAGLDYLVDSALNANDLNDPSVAGNPLVGQYAVLNTENRYINFAINLGASATGEGRANFLATYGTLSFRDVAAVAYETIIGTAAAQAAGVNVTTAIDFLARPENEAYLRAFVAQRAPGVDVELGIRAALVGQIMSAGATGDVGNYNAATERLITGALDGTFDGGITTTSGVNLLTAFPNAPSAGKSFTLTAAPDTAPSFSGTTGDDTYVATNATLSAADSLNGNAGNDTLRYSSSGAVAVNQSGFESASIETFQITSDAVGGTTFDTSNANNVTSLINDNSSSDLTITGLNVVTGVTVRNTSQPTGATVNTTLNYNAAAVAGTSTVQNVTLENVFNPLFAPGTVTNTTITANGVETFNVTGAGTAGSNVAALVSNSLTAVTIGGSQGVTIGGLTFAGATGSVDGSKSSGGINVTLTNSGAADVTVLGGSGADRADFSNGFAAKDSFNGGDGIDTLGLSNAVATGVVGGTVSNIEVLEISTGGTGTVDLSKFAGVNSVVYTSAGIGTGNSLVGATVVSKVGATTTVTIDAGTVGNTLAVTPATDSAADALTLNINKIGAADVVGVVTATDMETLTLNVADDAAVLGTGVLTLGGITSTKAKSITLNSSADVTFGATSGSAALTSFDASTSTGKINLTAGTGLTTSLAGATIKLGSSDDMLVANATAGVATGGDTITLGGGKDTVTYTALAQSGDKTVDTIVDFVSGTDKLDLTGVGLNTSTLYLGGRTNFGLAQGALTGVAGQTVFQSDTSTLWVDINGDQTLNAADLRIILSGNTAITAADLSLGVGASITLTAPAASTTTLANNAGASGKTTNENDTITTSIANLAGSTVNGGLGTDTLVISDAGVVAVPGTVTSVETLTLANGTNTVTLAGGTNFTAINGGTGADTVSLTNLVAGGAVNLGAGADVVTGATEAIIEGAASTFVGGADADSLTFAAGLTTANLDLSKVSAFETIDLGAVAGGGLTTTNFASGVTTLIGDTTAGNITVNLTAAQLDALTTITSAAAGSTFALATTDTGAVTVNLADTTYTTLVNVDSVNFAASGANLVTVTVDELIPLMTAGTNVADQVNVTANLGAATLNTAAFEVINVTATQTGLTVSNSVTTVTANAGGTFVLGTGGDTFNSSGAAAYVVTGSTGADIFNHSGSGTITVNTGGAGTNAINASGTGAVTVNEGLAGGISTIALNAANAAVDNIRLADGAGTVGVATSADRFTVTGFNTAQDTITLDVNQTTVATAAGNPLVIQTVGAAGAVLLASTTTDLTILNYDMGGSTEVLNADLTGANLLANLGGAMTAGAGNADDGYILAYDNGNAYLYAYTNATSAGVLAAEIALVGVVNGAAIGSLGSADFVLGA